MKKSMTLNFLGTSHNGKYHYYLALDNYVYQFYSLFCLGWYCSGPAWERTLHNCLDA